MIGHARINSLYVKIHYFYIEYALPQLQLILHG